MISALVQSLSNFVPFRGDQTSEADPTWATFTYELIRQLSSTHSQFTGAVHPPALLPQHQFDLKSCKAKFQTSLQNSYSYSAVRPTLFLRVIVPRTGFTVVVRALLDTGSSLTAIGTELATLLTEKGGAHLQYRWPREFLMFDGDRQPFYRSLLGLQLQSVGLQGEPVTADVTTHHFVVEERCSFFMDQYPVCTEMASQMSELGIPLVTGSDVQGERTMWSKEEEGSEHRFDMVIGQDLLNRHFLLKYPIQSTYLFSTLIAFFRTTMGLTLIGLYSDDFHKFWKPSEKEVTRMKEILVSKHQVDDDTEDEDSKEQQKQIEEALTVDLDNSRAKLQLKDYFSCFLSLLHYLHLLLFFLLSSLFTLLFQAITTLTFARHFSLPVISLMTTTLHTVLLRLLLQQAIKMRALYNSTLAILQFHFLSDDKTIPLQEMPFNFRPHIALKVSRDCSSSSAKSSTVSALIDTGSYTSYISPELIEQLQLETTLRPKDTTPVTFSEQAYVNIGSAVGGGAGETTGWSLNTANVELFSLPALPSRPRRSLPSKLATKVSALLGGVDLVSDLHSQTSSSASASTNNGGDDEDEWVVEQVRLGVNLIPLFLLMYPCPSLSSYRTKTPKTDHKQIMPLGTASLSAVPTCLGWVVQGVQTNDRLSGIINNWRFCKVAPFTEWKALTVCLVSDLAFASFVYLYFY